MQAKQILREKLLKERRNIPPARRLVKSRKIFQKLFRDPSFQKAGHVALYYGIASEVATRPFLKTILKEKKLYLPKVSSRGRGMTLCRIRSCPGDLVKGAYAIMEPAGFCPTRPANRMDLIVVPGVAFDGEGGRLGRGAGYYDCFLRKAPKVTKIGLCFREQLVKKVPMKKHDVRMDLIISD